MSDFLLLAVEGLFALLFVASLWTAVRHRNPLAWDVTLVFMPIATLLVVQLAGQAFGPLPQWVRTASSVFLLAQPLFSLKLVSDIRTVPRWLLPVAVIAFGTTAVLVIAAAGQAAVPVTLAAVGVFVVTEAVAAGYFALEAQRRSGTARLRLAIASFATAALALALFVAGAAAAAGAPAELTNLLARLMALVAVLGYWIAFLPPGWLRRTWQATEAFTYHERLLASPPSAEPGALWTELAQATQHLTGAATVVLVADESALRVVAAEGVELDGPARYSTDALTASPDDGTAPIRRDLCARSGFSVAREVPIVRDRERVGLVVLLRRHASLFDMEDASLVASLAARSANLVQRREVLAEQERLNEQLARTVTALEAAGAAKSDFLASMSHELRTPLNAIIGFSELMVAGSGDTETVSVPREWIDHIRNGGSHLVSLINDVLDLSKVEAGRLELVKVPIQLGHAVAESVAGLRPLADRKQQRIDVEIAPIVIEVDAGRFRQILYNLLSNAIKYTGEGGSIKVSAAAEGDAVRLAVEDTGVGIAADDLGHVFEEFRQVGDRSAHVAGSGLGLALTKRLVEAHDGGIEVRSTLGRGSTFTVTMPIGKPAVPAVPDTVDAIPAVARGARVLIIEDDPSSVRLLQAYLAESGYEVSVAPNGEIGLDMAQADPPAAILLDILLPRIDGWEVLRRLKSDPLVRDIPVVIVTVVDERGVGLALGAVDYFVKPIERDALIARLDRHTFTTKVKARPVTILAIDDDPASLAMIDATLSPLGFGVQLAPSGKDGLELANRIRPDLVICDLLMPGLDGFEVVGELQADEATAAIPILIVTGHELTEADKARLNGRVLGVVNKGEAVAHGLRDWLRRVVPDMVAAAPE